MSVEHFVGRNDAVKRVQDVLTGQDHAADGNLTVLSIEGPGGIGKTYLFDHAFRGVDLSDRNYLILRANGGDLSDRPVARMVDRASAEVIRGKPSGYYFPSVDRVGKTMDAIKAEAAVEFQGRHPNAEEGRMALLRFLDLAFEVGIQINKAIPITKPFVDFRQLGETKTLIEKTLPLLAALQQQGAPIWELLGLWRRHRAQERRQRECVSTAFRRTVFRPSRCACGLPVEGPVQASPRENEGDRPPAADPRRLRGASRPPRGVPGRPLPSVAAGG